MVIAPVQRRSWELSCGHADETPLKTERQEVINESGANRNETIDFPKFLPLMARRMKDTDAEEELNGAFMI